MHPGGNLLFKAVASTEFIIHFQDETHGWRCHSGCASHQRERYLSECTSHQRATGSTLIVAARIDVVGLSDRMPAQHAKIQRACGGSR